MDNCWIVVESDRTIAGQPDILGPTMDRTRDPECPEALMGFPSSFNEFQVARIGDLLRQLKKAKPEGSKSEASIQEDTPHISCVQPFTSILVTHSRADMGKGVREPVDRYN
jgi:hypothetical protein